MRTSRKNPDFARMPATANIKQVAKLAGVSTATVSRVMSGQNCVVPELVQRVMQAAASLNYQPNRAARNLRAGCSRMVGVLIPDIENPFYTSVVRGIEETLRLSGYSLLLANYNENPEQESVHLSNCRAEGIAGMIFSQSRKPSSLYAALANSRFPLVAISRNVEHPAIDLVLVDNVGGARTAVEHLLELGHRRIALITGPSSISTARERKQGYTEAFERAGLKPPKDLIVSEEFRQQGGYQAMQLLASRPSPPTAVFAASNLMTLGALQAIHERELEIPRDISVMGFDDLPWATSLRPPLTAIAQPAGEVGKAAARLLLERIKNPHLARRHLVLQTNLVVRLSCSQGALPQKAKA